MDDYRLPDDEMRVAHHVYMENTGTVAQRTAHVVDQAKLAQTLAAQAARRRELWG